LASIPINYSIHTMKNFGVKVFPPHPLTSLFKYIMIIERLFTIYTPIATVVSAYIYLTLFLKVFGYATPSLLTGTNTATSGSTKTSKASSDSNQRQFNDSNKNLTASAYHALDRVLAEYVLTEICSLQSIFIKMGQYVASRPDLVSSLWATTLSQLHDNCPISSSLYVKTIVETCLTLTKNKDDSQTRQKKLSYQKKKLRSLDELFESFDMKPIASGCIAQYHQATMVIDQQLYEVVVKVQHPTIETLFEIDMSALKAIVTIATKFYSKWTVGPSSSALSP
jgi:predicted unusual protein kinase regulating ubiquinone biosynthesis (AarF/ABC1/UbiB family)